MAVNIELKDGQQRIGEAKDDELPNGKHWIENEFWIQLPGRKDKPENKITWTYDSSRMQHTMLVRIDGREGKCDFYDNTVRDCPTDRTVQKTVKRFVKQLAKSLGL